MKVLVLVCFIVFSFGCASRPQSEAEIRLRRYFQLPRNVDIESKPSPLLSKLPVGTPEKEIYDFLESNGIGKDGMSSYYPSGKRGEIVVRVEYDLSSPILVKEHFGILLQMDDERKLNDIKVLRWVTGP